MQARVTTMKAKPGRVDDIVRKTKESVVPALGKQKGFKGIIQLVDQAGDRAISITLWETVDDLDACEANGYYAAAIESVVDAFAESHAREVWEVSLRK